MNVLLPIMMVFLGLQRRSRRVLLRIWGMIPTGAFPAHYILEMLYTVSLQPDRSARRKPPVLLSGRCAERLNVADTGNRNGWNGGVPRGAGDPASPRLAPSGESRRGGGGALLSALLRDYSGSS
jgi:hypothetical protein